MSYFIVTDGGYIVGIGSTRNNVRTPISAEEAEEIRSVLAHKPTPPDGYDYRLKTDLTWELYELPAADEDPELTAEEALSIIVGGAT